MAVVIAIYDAFPLVLADRRVYTAQACGREREDGTWEGWLEFVPSDDSLVLRTQRETTQASRADLEYWAGGLTPVYLQGALERTLTASPPVSAERPDIPAVYEEPAPTGAVTPLAPTPIGSTTPVPSADLLPPLDPFAVYAQGEKVLAMKLAALTPTELRAIIVNYRLADSAAYDFDTMSTAELAVWIVGAVKARLAA
jgi:hypothetical protein